MGNYFTAGRLRKLWETQRWNLIRSWLVFAAFGWLIGLRWLAPFLLPITVIVVMGGLWVIVQISERFTARADAKEADKFKDRLVYVHPVVGTFQLDWKNRNYECKCRWQNAPITISIDDGGADEPVSKEALATLEALWRDAASWDTRFQENILENMLDAYNKSYNVSDAEKTREEFLAAVRIDSIHVYDEGTFNVYYECGDMFGDHQLQISGSIDMGLKPATEVG